MSILGNTETLLSPSIIIGFIVACSISAALGVRVGVHRPAAVVGRERMPADARPSELLFALAMGLGSWLLAQFLYLNWRGLVPRPGQPAPAMTMADKAFFAAIPPLAFFATLCLADAIIGGYRLIASLGLNPGRAPDGVRKGLLAAVIILPPTYAMTFVFEWVYIHIQFQHPHEHELLKFMSESPSLMTRLAFILAAVVVAPLAEEFVFRGHVQTFLRRALVLLSSRLPLADRMIPTGGFPVVPALAPAAPVKTEPVSQKPAAWQTWLAIGITSCLFSMVHPMWSWPTIFVLSVGLGYCYERTGNIWTNVTVHCLFNAVSVSVYLHAQQP